MEEQIKVDYVQAVQEVKAEYSKLSQQTKEWQADYLARRARNEMRIAKLAEVYPSLPDEFKNILDLPEVITVESIMPEFYAEHPDLKVCEQQLSAWKEKEALFNMAVLNYMKERVASCESELARLNSKTA